MVTPYVPRLRDERELRAAFRWELPARFNLGVACSDAHAPTAEALVELFPDGERRVWTFGDLSERSNRFANALRALGVGRGDRVALVLGQGIGAATVHLGTYKAAAVALPFSELHGSDAIRHRLADSDARVVATGPETAEVVLEVAAELGVQVVVDAPAAPGPARTLASLLADASPRFDAVDTAADDPAYLIYTSGTTAAAKGVLHAHRSLFGHLPCLELGNVGFPQAGDRYWTPADWAWMGGLMDAFLPSLFYGVPVVATPRARFDPEWAGRVLDGEGVRNAFLPPTALRLMKNAGVRLRARTLRSAISGGEALGADVLDWGRDALGVTIAEIYGQTEANLLVGNAPGVWDVRPGSMGRPYPGHHVDVIGPDGEPVADGEDGEVALRLPNPVAFLEYLNAPEATAAKTGGGWLRTGDVARRDPDGWLWFVGRADDLIISSGYRIAPLEVEASLLTHPAVAAAAVVGVPDETRGQVVKAFVVPAQGVAAGDALADELRAHVRERLAAYEYPRRLEFVRELPQTVTGKIRRAALAEAERG
ncbi:MAG TPA: AMP-binding protein [Gaiellaceae bacterium]|nr:AMP-binding protein [Gaiellaceae bacterium]